MSAWTSDELSRIGQAEELEITSIRRNGTLSSPRTIWVVRLGDDLYVRSVYGRSSAWFRGAQSHLEGHIEAGGVARDVTFVEETGPGINDRIDAAYRSKYRRYVASIVDSTVTAQARAATLKLVPRAQSESTTATAWHRDPREKQENDSPGPAACFLPDSR